MSIKCEINARVRDGSLLLVEHSFPAAKTERHVFVGQEVIDGFNSDNWVDPSEALRFGELRQQFDWFTQGGIITVGWDPYDKKKTAQLARTDPVQDEVWDFRCTDPKPSIRVFGRFALPDVFIALEWRYRKEMGGPGCREWNNMILNTIGKWDALFPEIPPHQGATLDEYITKDAVIV